MSGIITTPYEAARSYYTAFPTPVLTADEYFLDVMQVELVSGRWLNSFDQDTAARTAVVGIGLADEFGFREGTEPSSSTTSTTASSVWWSATRSTRSSTMP